MRKALIILGVMVAILGIAAYFIVFTPGTYEFASSGKTGSTSGTLSFNTLVNGGSTSTASTTNASGSNNAFAAAGLNTTGGTGSTYSSPYPLNWSEGPNNFSITGVLLQGNQLLLSLKVQVGNTKSCVPINLRLVTDESGDVEAPNQIEFNFPDTHACTGTPGASYDNQIVSFQISPSMPIPFLFTTGGTSNQFFQVATTTGNGLQVELPDTSG